MANGKVPNQVSLRLGDDSRRRRIKSSLDKEPEFNVNKWIRDAIDLRLYLEARNIELEYILTGELFRELERSNSVSSLSENTVTSLLTEGQLEEIVKMIMRSHALLKCIGQVVIENQNINHSLAAKSFSQLFEHIKKSTDEFHDSQFKEGA